MEPRPFCVSITTQQTERLQLVTHRVAHHERTCTLQESPQVTRAREKIGRYRETFLRQFRSVCAKRNNVDYLIRSFVQMSDTLDVRQVIALHIAADEKGVPTSSGCLPGDSFMRPRLHPLIFALLAFHMGGAVNAANSLQYRTWKSRNISPDAVPDFLIEGDSSDMFDEYRLTLAWEMHERRLTKPSGNLTIFQRGEKEPRPLTSFTQAFQRGPAGPVAVVYNSKSAALWYDCKDTRAVRRSVSLDLHVNTITDNDLELLSPVGLTAREAAGLTLWDLVTRFPTRGYDNTFHHLLFANGAFDATLDMIALLDMPVGPAQTSKTQHGLLGLRYQEWERDNLASVPPALRSVRPFQISGVYTNPKEFLKVVYNKALQDNHLMLGMDMVPQSPVDAEREYARKFIRDSPDMVVARSILDYKQCLMTPYTIADLITTEQICEHGYWLRTVCFELAGTGYIDELGLLPAIGSLSATLGHAVNGSKKCRIGDFSWVTVDGLEIFRVKSLYLFWCADWLARYFAHPQEGPVMISGPCKGDFEFGEQKAVRTAQLLLRNWVAWSLLVESLSKGASELAAPEGHGM